MGVLGILFGVGKSSIGGVVIDATVEEGHNATAEVTENPVEEGAKITDHVQNNSDELVLDCIISDSPLGFPIIGNIQNIINSVSTLFGLSSRSVDAYNKLLELKKNREPFTAFTGLRRYTNMVIKELNVTRNARIGKAISFRCAMRQIRIVTSKSGGLQNLSGGNVAKGKRNVKNLGRKTINETKKVTDAVPAVSPNSSEEGFGLDVTQSQNGSSVLFDTFK